MTVGPLQMGASPFTVGDAIDEAASRISGIAPLEPKTVAAFWNGPRADSPTRHLPYSEALKMAIPIARSAQRSMRIRDDDVATVPP